MFKPVYPCGKRFFIHIQLRGTELYETHLKVECRGTDSAHCCECITQNRKTAHYLLKTVLIRLLFQLFKTGIRYTHGKRVSAGFDKHKASVVGNKFLTKPCDIFGFCGKLVQEHKQLTGILFLDETAYSEQVVAA